MSDGGTTPGHTQRRSRRWRAVVGVAVALLFVALAVWLLRPPANTPVSSKPSPRASPSPTPSAAPDPCETPATEAFVPERVDFPGIAKNLKVLALPRDGRDVPSVPPTAAKRAIAWDRPPGIEPGSDRGNVLMNAHTWPDGTALGNLLLKELDEGDRVIVRGGGTTLCYEVEREVEVRAADGFPEYYDREGPPQLAFLVCSGQRLGPGSWTHRTIWFATPV